MEEHLSRGQSYGIFHSMEKHKSPNGQKRKAFQLILIAIVEVITLMLLALWMDGLTIQSISAAAGVMVIFVVIQVLYWWLFVNFFSWFPVWLYPIFTFFLADVLMILFGNLIPGIRIEGLTTGLTIAAVLTGVNALLSGLFSLDMDDRFDRYVIHPLVVRHGNPVKATVPGFLFLEIDGLSEKLFHRALAEGYLPTLKRWLDSGSHQILGWETDFTSQSAASQTGILIGNNDNIPAYRWWDRLKQHIIHSGDPREAIAIETRLSNGKGLLSRGGSSRSNLYSGDASESLFTSATLLDRDRELGPGFYLYLLNPFVVARLLAEFCGEVIKEWWQNLRQRLRKDKYITSARTLFYAFLRAIQGPFFQDLTTFTVISDLLRGVPAIYALYPSYDDVAHFTGIDTPDAFGVLAETDRHFARIERALKDAPRPYHIIVLSDHGQSVGPTFKAAHGVSLPELVKGLLSPGSKVFAALNTHEAWDKVNAFLNETIHADTRMARVMRTMLHSKMQDDLVTVGPELNPRSNRREQTPLQDAGVIVLASGCNGLIYFPGHAHRLTYEEIQQRYPDLILGLTQHPGIGFLLVRSQEQGDMILSHKGIYFLDDGSYEGENPLAVYGPHAPQLLKRESSFSDCPDLIVNTSYDPLTEELCGFENQVGHHGGLGGPQNHPFIFYPAVLPIPSEPIVGATQVYQLLNGWRDQIQQPSTTLTTKPVQSVSKL